MDEAAARKINLRRITSMDEAAARSGTESTNKRVATDDTEYISDAENAEGIPRIDGPTGDPDIDSSLELIIGTFPDESSADEAYKEIKEAEKEALILLVGAAVVNRDEGTFLHVKEERDWPGRAGALLGGGIGTILGMMGGPIGLVVGGAAGAAIGGAAAGMDAAMPDEQLKEFAKNLKPGTSMVIVVVAHLWSKAAAGILLHAGGEVNTTVLTADLAQRLDVDSAGR